MACIVVGDPSVIVVQGSAGAFVTADYAKVGVCAICSVPFRGIDIAAFCAFLMMRCCAIGHIFPVMHQEAFVNFALVAAIGTVGGVSAGSLMLRDFLFAALFTNVTVTLLAEGNQLVLIPVVVDFLDVALIVAEKAMVGIIAVGIMRFGVGSAAIQACKVVASIICGNQLVIVVQIAAGALIATVQAVGGIGAVCTMRVRPAKAAAVYAFRMMSRCAIGHHECPAVVQVFLVDLTLIAASCAVGGVVAAGVMASRRTDIAAVLTAIMVAFCAIGDESEIAGMGDGFNRAFVAAIGAVGGVSAGSLMLRDFLFAAPVTNVAVTLLTEGDQLVLIPVVANGFNRAFVAAVHAVGEVGAVGGMRFCDCLAADSAGLGVTVCTIGGIIVVFVLHDLDFAFVVAVHAVGGVIAAGAMLVNHLFAACRANVAVAVFAEDNILVPVVRNVIDVALVVAEEVAAMGGIIAIGVMGNDGGLATVRTFKEVASIIGGD